MENEQVRIIQLKKMHRDGAASMVLHQVGAAPDPNPRRGPPSTTDGDSVHGRASIRQSKATGHKDSTDTLRMMQWNAEVKSNIYPRISRMPFKRKTKKY